VANEKIVVGQNEVEPLSAGIRFLQRFYIVGFGDIHSHNAAGMGRKFGILKNHLSTQGLYFFTSHPAHQSGFFLENQFLAGFVLNKDRYDAISFIASGEGQLIIIQRGKQSSGEAQHQLLHAVEDFDTANAHLAKAIEELKK